MRRAGERSYVYAKASAIIGRSFVGKRIGSLGAVNWLAELDRLIFPAAYRDLPEKELLVDLERRVMERAAKEIVKIVNCFSRPPELLVRLLRSYEYSDLKAALAVLAGDGREPPVFTDLGRFGQVNFGAWPDLAAMLKGTEFGFLRDDPAAGKAGKNTAGNGDAGNGDENTRLQTALDVHYYTKLWEALLAVPVRDRLESGKMVAEEIALRNVVWAIRLRTYYGMDAGEIRGHLVHVETGRGGKRRRSLTEDAEAALDCSPDNFESWRSWRRAALLNPEIPGRHWKIDPRHVQNAAAEHLYRMARLGFHKRPFTLDATVCYIKLKLFEEDLLTSVAEGLTLGLQSREVLELLEAAP
ncbi:MAG: V-type ATPase subunit [Spirochaetaceae bacterium]|jgi:vacuolar-type H+-ATPase subunit C/Vma6|nr:V-type ATPase subunit [Spirochaetaceae bacterium]